MGGLEGKINHFRPLNRSIGALAMSLSLRCLALSATILIAAASATAADKALSVAEVQNIALNSAIDLQDLPAEMTLSKLLKLFEAKLPNGKKVSLSIDATAFGEKRAQIAEAKIDGKPLRAGFELSLSRAMNIALAQLEGEFDIAIQPRGLTITPTRVAAYTMTYDIRDLMRHKQLLAKMKEKSPDSYRGVDPADKTALLLRCLVNDTDLRRWENLEVVNGAHLNVVAALSRQEKIVDILWALHAQSDLAVVMNARLYEVSREFYAKHVAPVLAKRDDEDERPALRWIDGPLFKKIAQQKLLASSEEEKIEPATTSIFLSKQAVVRYAGPAPGNNSTALTGVSFEVRPLVSLDRRYLRVQITQKVSQLVGIGKAKALDTATGKEIEVEAPNLRKTSVTGTVQFYDNGAILMPVDYRPPGKDGDEKVWLLLARPFIWIEAEMEERRGGGPPISPASYWDSDFSKEEEPEAPKFKPEKRLPDDKETKEILEAVIKHALTDAFLKDTRNFYGTARDKTFTLVDAKQLGWPEGFCPNTGGFKMISIKKDLFEEQRRVLGIRVDQFHAEKKADGTRSASIIICLFNAGGSANGAVAGGCFVTYTVERAGKSWKVTCHQLIDP